MLPILAELGPLRLVTHDVFTVLGLLVGLAIYYRELRRRGILDERIVIVSIAVVVGGAVGARLITAWEHLDYYALLGEAPLTWVIEHSGKSLIGAIAGGYLAGVLAKRALGYRRSTGDFYALAIPVAIVIGRIGCFLSELPLGTPTDLPWGIRVDPAAAAGFVRCPGCDLPMHPSMLYEIAFNVLAVIAILRWRRRVPVPGDLLKAYLLVAGAFRFLVEFVRGNEVQAFGLTGPQIVLIPLVGLLAAHFIRQRHVGAWRLPPAPAPLRPDLVAGGVP
ncbi:MAG: prolipoprotein diacylglyceryl transferase family protein [Chloroflexota bacterium]